jgi:hypothetical protein
MEMIYQVILWVFIGLVYASVGYLTNKLGDWSTVFEPMRLVITAIIGGIVGLILGWTGVELTPETIYLYLQMPLFAGMGILYVVEKVVKAILERMKVPQTFIP